MNSKNNSKEEEFKEVKNNEETLYVSEKGDSNMEEKQEEKVWVSRTITSEMVKAVKEIFEVLLKRKSKIGIYRHTLEHELGHMSGGIGTLRFIAMRVANHVVYLDKDMKLKPAYKPNHIFYGLSGVCNGVCFMYMETEAGKENVEEMAQVYISAVNGGPLATKKYCENETSRIYITTNRMNRFVDLNPVMDSDDEKVRKRYEIMEAKRETCDQALISKIKDNSLKAIEINNGFKNLFNVINDIDNKSLYEKLSKEQRFIVSAINRKKE